MPQLIHHLQNLQKKATEMQLYKKCTGLQRQDLTEASLRSSNPASFLQLLHFSLIDFSGRVFLQVLEQCTEIKHLTDRKFIESSFRILQRQFNCHPSLTPDQFFTNKYFVEKVALAVQVMAICLERDRALGGKKGLAVQKVDKPLFVQKAQRYEKTQKVQSRYVRIEKGEQKQSVQSRSAVQSRCAVYKSREFQEQEDQELDMMAIRPVRFDPKDIPTPTKPKAAPIPTELKRKVLPVPQPIDQTPFSHQKLPQPNVSREQFGQLVSMVKMLSGGLQSLVDKFEKLQETVEQRLTSMQSRIEGVEGRL